MESKIVKLYVPALIFVVDTPNQSTRKGGVAPDISNEIAPSSNPLQLTLVIFSDTIKGAGYKTIKVS